MSVITINGNTIDTQAHRPTLRTLGIDVDTAAGTKYILVQGKNELDREQKLELEALGPTILEYVSHATYLCRFDPDDISGIEAKPFVKWVNPYCDAFVVSPDLKQDQLPDYANGIPALAPAVSSNNKRHLLLTLHSELSTTAAELRTQLAQTAHVDEDSLELNNSQCEMNVEEQYIDALAHLDSVLFVEEVRPKEPYNNVARVAIAANDVMIQLANKSLALTGDGEIVAVADSGFDKGITTDTHPAFKGRVNKLYAVGRPAEAGNPALMDDQAGHGTHVCGSVLGKQEITSNGKKMLIQGTAPEAKLVVQSLHNGQYFNDMNAQFVTRGGVYNLLEKPYKDDHARIHTNSWGSKGPGKYDAEARDIDKFVSEHPDMVVLFAAGNAGEDPKGTGRVKLGQIGTQAWAKNCITVGAVESMRLEVKTTYGNLWPTDYPADPIKSDPIANKGVRGMVAFSSRGFDGDARIKPDVVAPGTCILSTKSRNISKSSATFEGSQDTRQGVPPSAEYFFDSGTSMACPLVAGCCALIRQALRRGPTISEIDGRIKPSAALIKALLINGAEEVKGQYPISEAGKSPNPNSGWGFVQVANSVLPAGKSSYPYCGYFDDISIKEGATPWKRIIDIPQTFTPGVWSHQKIVPQNTLKGRPTLKVTLVWTDPEGPKQNSPRDEILQNRLRLSVKVGGVETHGNRAPGDARWDERNNVQQVAWEKVPAGKVEVSVGTGHFATTADQKFALVWAVYVDRAE